MSHNKPNIDPHPLDGADHLESDQINGSPSTSANAAVKLECEKALIASRRGNQAKALRLIKDLCSKHENSSPHLALIHYVKGTVCVKMASVTDDPSAKQRCLRNAVESARRAASLSPSSIEFARFYANLLYEAAANEGKGYEEVVQECERALMIENPAEECVQGENDQQTINPTADARVTHVQNELRSLIQKSNIASISN